MQLAECFGLVRLLKLLSQGVLVLRWQAPELGKVVPFEGRLELGLGGPFGSRRGLRRNCEWFWALPALSFGTASGAGEGCIGGEDVPQARAADAQNDRDGQQTMPAFIQYSCFSFWSSFGIWALWGAPHMEVSFLCKARPKWAGACRSWQVTNRRHEQ